MSEQSCNLSQAVEELEKEIRETGETIDCLRRFQSRIPESEELYSYYSDYIAKVSILLQLKTDFKSLLMQPLHRKLEMITLRQQYDSVRKSAMVSHEKIIALERMVINLKRSNSNNRQTEEGLREGGPNRATVTRTNVLR